MSKRKDQLRSLFGVSDLAKVPKVGPAASPEPQAAPHSPSGEQRPARAASGAVRAMGLSLGNLSDEIEEAKRLRESLAQGEAIVLLDPAYVERSPFADRLSQGIAGDETFEALRESIKERGQQVPVLVRPHPDASKASLGWYQSAYGHRRIEAARQLGLQVRAIVQRLNDDELVVAQGKENAERRDLSFIERAVFADTLIRHGFDRATACAALGVHKSEMARLLQVAQAVDEPIARAIGPAPKAGRPRWIALGEMLSMPNAGARAEKLISSAEFQGASSDERFRLLFDLLQTKETEPSERAVVSESGQAIARFSAKGKAARITIPEDAGSGFAEFVVRELPRLHAAFFEQNRNG